MYSEADKVAHIAIKALIAGEKLKRIRVGSIEAHLIVQAIQRLRDTEYLAALFEEQLLLMVWRSPSEKTVYVETQPMRSV